MADMQCPYCGADQKVNHDDGAGYSEDVAHEHECSACEKVFTFTTFISFSYYPIKADCLNDDGDHDLKFCKSWPEEYSTMRCKCCDYQRKATTHEIEAAKQEAHCRGGAK